MQEPSFLEADSISIKYRDRHVFSNVSLNLKLGELLTIIGANGAGKTSLLKILATIISPSSGVVRILNQDAIRQRSLIGYLPESPAFYPDLRVLEQLKFYAKLAGINQGDIKSKIQEVLSLCQLENVQNQIAGKLSRGYKQRLGLALLLIKEPKLLILDEPASALDPDQRQAFLGLLQKLKPNHATIISTHLFDFVENLTDQVFKL